MRMNKLALAMATIMVFGFIVPSMPMVTAVEIDHYNLVGDNGKFNVAIYLYKDYDSSTSKDFYAFKIHMATLDFLWQRTFVNISSLQGICDLWAPAAGSYGRLTTIGFAVPYTPISFSITIPAGSVDINGGFTNKIQFDTWHDASPVSEYEYAASFWTDESVGFEWTIQIYVMSMPDSYLRYKTDQLEFSAVASKADVAVTSVSASPTSVRAGDPVTITVGVVNQGDFTETFDVNAYYVEPIITPTPEQWGTFWSMGDVTGNGYINEFDYNLILDHTTLPYDPQYDINKDGKVGIGDLMICAVNQGKDIWTYFAISHFIGKQTVSNLAAGGSTTLTFTWNTAGVSLETYTITIKAVASTVAGETDTADNIYVDGTVTFECHDMVVTSAMPKWVCPSTGKEYPLPFNATAVYPGGQVPIEVYVRNEGDFDETFVLTVNYDSAVIGTRQLMYYAGEGLLQKFTWNTTGVDYGTAGKDYTISATASVVPGEINTDNNSYTDGTVRVKKPGDITGDGYVNTFDLIAVRNALGVVYLTPEYEQNKDADAAGPGVTGPDGFINIFDLFYVRAYLGT